MKTKKQKIQIVEETEKIIQKSGILLFINFTALKFEEMKKLRKILKTKNNLLKIIKKRLLKVALKNQGIDFNPEQFEAQAAAIFSNQELNDLAAPVYKFAKKNKEGFKILGAYDLIKKEFIDAEKVNFIAQLPSKEIILARLIGMITAPLKMFLLVLQGRAEKIKN